ncbi:proteolipid protein 2-like [Daktulosphaira vitifoliae]|uniref:proteolipid protein 2-like n=1 Tax=Daktulosphaira vitifoliae TaxID=58002 RepID=UPI0021AA9534|nr:proteolipid protein 2-like [Daktulosphaira vitifoliae]
MTETVINVQNQDPKPGKPGTENVNVHNLFTWVEINYNYFKTLPGILKLAQLIIGIICLALASPARLPGTNWFLFVVIISFIATAIWSFIYLLSIREAINFPINWILTEFFNTLLLAVLYMVAFIVQISAWSSNNRTYNSYYKNLNIFAGIFGLINVVVYAAGVYLIFNDWKKSRTTSQ